MKDEKKEEGEGGGGEGEWVEEGAVKSSDI